MVYRSSMKKLLTLLSCLMTMSLYAQYSLGLNGVANARQLGGYQIGDKQIKPDQLLRTANLSTATEADVEILEQTYKVAYVFDFRSSYERTMSPDQELSDCENIWLPCLDKQVKGMGSSTTNSEKTTDPESQKKHAPEALGATILANLSNPQVQQMAEAMYPMIVFDSDVQANYATYLQRLATLPEGRSALWHCTQGKDRAGCASAFLLAALGADRQLIVEDFARSNDSYKELVEKLVAAAKEKGHTEQEINVIYALIGVSVPLFEKVLDMIDERYGSLDNYLTTALKCDDALREQLRKRFLR